MIFRFARKINPDASSETEKIQGAVRKPALQRGDDVHRALSDWAGDNAGFCRHPQKKGAIATGTIALPGVLTLSRLSLLSSLMFS